MKRVRFPNFCGVLAEGVRPDLLKINDCQERVNMEINTVGEVEKRMTSDAFSAISHGGTGQLTNAEYAGIRDLWIWYPRFSLSFNSKNYLFLVWCDPNDDNLGSLYMLYYDDSTHAWLKYDTGESDMNLFSDMYCPVGCQNTYGMIFADGRDNNPLRFVEVGDNDSISWGNVGQAVPLTTLSQDRTTTGNVYSSGSDVSGMNVVKGSILQYCYTIETDTGEEGNPSPVSSDDFMQNMQLNTDTSEPEWIQVSAALSGFSADSFSNNKVLKNYRVYRRDIMYTEGVAGAYPFRFVEKVSINTKRFRDASPYSDQEISYDNQPAPKGDDLGESGEVLFVANGNGRIQFPFNFDYFTKFEINNQNIQAFVNGIYKIRLFDEDIFGTESGHRTMYEILTNISAWKNLIRLFDIDQITPLPVVFETITDSTISFIQNGGFGSSAGWTFENTGGHGWFYGSTDAYCDGLNSLPVTLTGTVPSGLTLNSGSTYIVTLTMAEYSGSISGYLTPSLGGTNGKLMSCSAGTHSFVITAGAGSTFALLADVNTKCRIDNITIYDWFAFIYVRVPLIPAATIHELYFAWCETSLGVTDSSWQSCAYGEFIDIDTWTGQQVFTSLSRVRSQYHVGCFSGEDISLTSYLYNRGDALQFLLLSGTASVIDADIAGFLGKDAGITRNGISFPALTDYAEMTKYGNFTKLTAWAFIRVNPGDATDTYTSVIFSAIGDGGPGWGVGLLKTGLVYDKISLFGNGGGSAISIEYIDLNHEIDSETDIFFLFSISGMDTGSGIADQKAFVHLVGMDGTTYKSYLWHHDVRGEQYSKFRIGIPAGSYGGAGNVESIPASCIEQINLIGNIFVDSSSIAENIMNFMPRFASEWIGWDGTGNISVTFDPAQAIYDDSPTGLLRWSSTGGRAFPPLNYAQFPEEIVKIIPVRLLYQSTYAMSILVFTRSGYYRMILDGTSEEWRSKISQILIDEQSQYGTPYADSFIIVGDYVYFVNDHGVYRTYVNSGSPQNISKGYAVLPDVASFDYRLAVYVPQRDQILFHFEDVGTPANNETLVLDLQASSNNRIVWHRFTGMSIRGGDILRETDYNIFIDTNAGSSLLKQYPGSSYTTESAYVRSAKIEVGIGRLSGYCFDYTGTGSITARAYSTKLSGGHADTVLTPPGADESVAVPPGVIGKFFDFVLTGDTVKSFDALISDRG